MIHRIRSFVLPSILGASGALLLLSLSLSPAFGWGLLIFLPLSALGIYDVLQTQHNILRNYPVMGHLRFLLEDVGPELHQYVVESNTSGAPFNRDQRSLMYERAKGVEDKKPFGTELDVYASGYGWLAHSIVPRPAAEDAAANLRVAVGGAHCTQTYPASLLNISAMSFGALSAPAIEALNLGAQQGGFAHNTGEGGFSTHHRKYGGDIIWQIGTGYFGCRTDDGRFNPEMFEEQARDPQVKMIELKISQGAKPGHGGILPAAKVTAEIAEARRVPIGQDCLSPPGHSVFSTPIELLEFVTSLRERSGGKPVGFKLCVGDVREWLCICKAMLETGMLPDFITVDGAEGGTGAAPREFSDHLGMPLREGLHLVHSSLVGIGVRNQLKIAVSGKRVSATEIAVAMALGADWCNTARGFMFAVGCIQAQLCHTNRCPVGVATQDPKLHKALVVDVKAKRAQQFHRNTMQALAEFTAAAGLDHPSEFTPEHVYMRTSPRETLTGAGLFPPLEEGQLTRGPVPDSIATQWAAAEAASFHKRTC
jgi:glutamate synthase domain-containing protein 2